MSIVSHVLQSDIQNGNRRDVIYRFIDHLGIGRVVSKFVQTGFDTNADMLSMYATIEEDAKQAEYDSLIEMIENGIDVLPSVQSPKYSTSKRLAKALIRYMMREKDPYIVLTLEPLIIYLRANYNNAQLRNFLDITAAQASKMNNRINAILNNKADFVIYDSNAEDIA